MRYHTFFCLIAIVAVNGSTDAALITTPLDLNQGDLYRLVFVTEGGTPATSGSATDYNNFVSSQAASSGGLNALGTTWTAMISIPSQNAQVLTGTLPGTDGAGIPIYNVGGERIANSYADLWDGTLLGDLSSTATGGIRYDQFGVDGPGSADAGGLLVWTGTSEFGAIHNGGLGDGASLHTVGHRIQNTFQWMRGQGSTIATPSYRVYGISGVLTADSAAIPEPTSLALLGMTAAAARD